MCQASGSGVRLFAVGLLSLVVAFFFKQKMADGLDMWLELRRVLFRSPSWPARRRTGSTPPPRPPRSRACCGPAEIGRASCRERVEVSGGAGSLHERGRGGRHLARRSGDAVAERGQAGARVGAWVAVRL